MQEELITNADHWENRNWIAIINIIKFQIDGAYSIGP